MSDFGAKFLGNSGQVIIDQDHPCLHLVAEGRFTVASGWVTITYPAPINSPIPPLVFINPDGAGFAGLCDHLGSAGNWTGLKFTWGNLFGDDFGYSPSGSYKVGAVMLPQASTQYGLLIRDSLGRNMFDSARPMFRIVSGQQSWSKVGFNDVFRGYGTINTWGVTWSYGSSGYFMISQVAQDVVATGAAWSHYIGFHNSIKDQVWVALLYPRTQFYNLNGAYTNPLVVTV